MIINRADQYFDFATTVNGLIAAENYIKAASEYINYNRYYEAGLSFVIAAEIFKINDANYQAAVNYSKAAKMFRIINVQNDEESSLKCSITFFENDKNYKLAASDCCKLAYLYHRINNYDNAIIMYERASLNYKKHGDLNNHIESLVKASHVLINKGDHEKALLYLNNIYTAIIPTELIKSIFLDISILILYLYDTVALTKYLNTQNNLILSKEYHLLYQLITIINQHQLIEYEKLIFDYNAVFKLDTWMISLLDKIKDRI